MRFVYAQPGEGEGFQSPDDLFPTSGLMDFLLSYGQEGLDALESNPDEELQALVQEMIDAGLLEKGEGGQLRPTPRLVQGIQHRALLEIFSTLNPGVRDGHVTASSGRGGERTDGTRPYQYGDPIGELAIHETLRNALARAADGPGASPTGRGAPDDGPRPLPLDLRESDFELHNVEATAEAATVVLIDLSGSMGRYERHIAAKKVALGLKALVRTRFPLDTIDFVGFASTAEAIAERDLPLVMPKPITTRDWRVRVRVPLEQAGQTHPHFTNLQHGLQTARAILARRGAPNKQVLVITDGEPTAHLTRARDGLGQTLNLLYPPEESSAEATLEEALRCTQAGIRVSTFALIEEYHAMDWVGFVERMTRLVRGVAYYCTAGDLAATIMESYLTGKKRRQALG